MSVRTVFCEDVGGDVFEVRRTEYSSIRRGGGFNRCAETVVLRYVINGRVIPREVYYVLYDAVRSAKRDTP